jgi:Lrp/AsnC family transcriptional regulator for asnA, asnC and gidA
MDEIDRKILDIMREDAKMPYYQIANKVGIGTTTVHSRIQKLLKKGIIERFSAIINYESVGYDAFVVLGLSVEPDKIRDVAQKIAAYDEVQMVGVTAGDHDIVVELLGKDTKTIGRFINEKIKTIDGIRLAPGSMDISFFTEVYKHIHGISLVKENGG